MVRRFLTDLGPTQSPAALTIIMAGAAVLPTLLTVLVVIPRACHDFVLATCVEELWKEETVRH
jgi:hypothetical protein|eukprot:COSAG01_NODE_48746_length_378_cov_1.089606_1_plen_63_part_00